MDDDLPRPTPRLLTPAHLDPLGTTEIAEYVTLLKAEIVRAEAVLARKQDVRGAADAVFGRRAPQ